MPILGEREITGPVELCDEKGELNPEAVGWSRTPLHICNLSGHYPRKKKWNFWIVLNEAFALSITVANIDYTGLLNVNLMEFGGGGTLSDNVVLTPKGAGIDLPERADRDVTVVKKNMKIAFLQEEKGVRLRVDCPRGQNGRLRADIFLDRPTGHETLNVVIPWDRKDNFHFTSKQNTLAARGRVQHGDKEYVFEPENSFGVLDFGRGMWPKNFTWNWGSFNHRQDGDLIGINIGGKWTDGTGYTENGVCLNGKLYKISEDLAFEYDTSDFMKPWKIRTDTTDMLDLVLTPFYDKTGGPENGSDSGGSGGLHQCFGHFSGKIKIPGRTLDIRKAFGWAEQVIGNW